MKYWIVTLSLVLSLGARAQLPSNRVKPGIMYHAGDTVRSPRLGISSRIPVGWDGVLPRDTEVFLLLPATNLNGEIYVLVNDKLNIQEVRKRWEAGVELSPGLRLQVDGNIMTRGTDIIAAYGSVSGEKANTQGRIYLEAKCSPYGFCLSFMATADPSSIERVKGALQYAVDNTSFVQPSNESPFKNFDWKKFLSGKILLSVDDETGGKRKDEVDMCADGTFQSRINRTGIFKGRAKEYHGKKTGKWDVKSNASKAIIALVFEKLAPVEIEIEARDEEIYIKGERCFIGESEICNK